MNDAAIVIQELADDDAKVIFGAVIDESLGAAVRVTVVASDIERER